MKVVGLILIFVSVSSIGIIKSEVFKISEKKTRAFIEFIYFIKREIGSYLTVQEEIFEKFENKVLENSTFLPKLREMSRRTSDKVLFNTLKIEKETLNLKKEVFDILLDFSRSFGNFSGEEEMKRCDRAILELEEILKKQKEETFEKTRLLRTAFFAVGFGIVLLLL